MRIEYNATGPPEIVREDGWRYRLDGIGGIEVGFGDEGYDFRWSVAALPSRSITLTVTIFSLDDKTLNSIRVLRDELTDCTIRLHHDY